MIAERRRTNGFDVRAWRGGEGPPCLYLHGFEQHPGDAPFLNALAQTRRVLAPEHPGYGSSSGVERLRDIHDMALYYRAVIEGWDVGPVDLVGHCLGGMFAAELAILAPHLVRNLVLIAPYGLWRDDCPLPDPFVFTRDALAKAKWADTGRHSEETSAFDAADGDSPATYRTINLTTATRFLWPIPDRGLSRRAPYLHAQTLVLFGEADALVPPTYSQIWADTLPAAQTQIISGSGHMPMFEAREATVEAINTFLG